MCNQDKPAGGDHGSEAGGKGGTGGVGRHDAGPRGQQGGLYHFAWFSRPDEAYEELRGMCLPEDWDFMDGPGRKSHWLLRNYLENTFLRLEQEGEILYGDSGAVAAFNTGLVDEHYEDIYARFTPNRNPDRQRWWFDCFLHRDGSSAYAAMCREFPRLPDRASYFATLDDMVFDWKKGVNLNYDHIILDRIYRFPVRFLERTLGSSPAALGVVEDARKARDDAGREEALKKLIPMLGGDRSLYKAVQRELDAARDNVLRRVSMNYTVAVPHYYPSKGAMDFILPLFMTDEDEPDCILLVGRRGEGYYGATILETDLAYPYARLLMRPSDSWLGHMVGRRLGGGDRGDVVTPVLTWEDPHADEATARLTGAGLEAIVHDGDTIGRPGGRDGAAPDILLGPGHTKVSRIHGTFSRRGEVWCFTDTSTNGTRVMRGDDVKRLERGEPFELRPGDGLSLAAGPYIVFECPHDETSGGAGVVTPAVRDIPQGHDGDPVPPAPPAPVIPPTARLSVNGTEAEVGDGTTIGCRRDAGREYPDIAVDACEGPNQYVSQIHGLFELRDGTWYLTSRGRNGTDVVRDGTTHQLEDGTPFGLEDGDLVSLAGGPGMVFSCPSGG